MIYALGLLYSFLWATAAIAGKFGLKSAGPVELLEMRLLITSIILLTFGFFRQKERGLPKLEEWKLILVYGCIGTGLYLGSFFYAIQTVSAGLVNLIVATSPMVMLAINVAWSKRNVGHYEISGMTLSLVGLGLAAYPNISISQDSIFGIAFLVIGMIGFAVANIYFSKFNLSISRSDFNGWQLLVGGCVLLPFLFIKHNSKIVLNLNLVMSVLWLVVAVSILAVSIWFYLLKIDPVKASQWLYLSPVIGYILSYIFLGEPITIFSILGTLLVISGLFIARKK